ncbi:hypothetical protein GALMADRAFT_911529 [Galerina marginata CBS 339.88]|uniref:Uncharacterized protein n=1 Tax=Galerina marginata (strain CBS 339.88) TaxID=685588 RepID=A0A067SQ50_GALM3|nr:hypothetical protein GALMADRAFT_911529 [Galerina marginata CBS 339.88]
MSPSPPVATVWLQHTRSTTHVASCCIFIFLSRRSIRFFCGRRDRKTMQADWALNDCQRSFQSGRQRTTRNGYSSTWQGVVTWRRAFHVRFKQRYSNVLRLLEPCKIRRHQQSILNSVYTTLGLGVAWAWLSMMGERRNEYMPV